VQIGARPISERHNKPNAQVFRHREIACAILIDTRGRLLFQRRDKFPSIIQPGKISLFGGHREGKETYRQCVVREIHEEISYFVSAGRFRHLTSYDGDDLEVRGGSVHAEFYVADGIPADKLLVTEGSLLIADPDQASRLSSQFTPYAGLAIGAFRLDHGSRPGAG
jgi:8-oxo-dGTP diphosphatase